MEGQSASRGGPWAMIAWVAFPLVPTVLGTAYHRTLNFLRVDPRAWDRDDWLLMLGPLLGYGFLVGALAGLPEREAEGRGRARRWIGRRWVGVGVGPWAGFLVWFAIYHLDRWIGRWTGTEPLSLIEGPDWLVVEIVYGLVLPTLAYPWVVVAIGALWRARRLGVLRPVLRNGLVTAVAFVGSLFGGFWAATAVWRSYFFDPTAIRLLVVGLLIVTLAGCSGPTTLGEVRRRDLFEAMLPAWLIGLALIWQWRSRRRD